MPALVAASMSMVSTPTPYRTIARHRCAPPILAASTAAYSFLHAAAPQRVEQRMPHGRILEQAVHRGAADQPVRRCRAARLVAGPAAPLDDAHPGRTGWRAAAHVDLVAPRLDLRPRPHDAAPMR